MPVRVEAKRGKGSHITLYYGPRKTTVKDLRKEVAPGLLSAMIRQLGLTRRDLR
ncbi:MAG: type II toxin-antitoxin system HicA family toxin [Desulfurellaceae bacterium]|nr:type II toxin-antitoxin system HicA family toxin [Desulfurellaceae bacterium]